MPDPHDHHPDEKATDDLAGKAMVLRRAGLSYRDIARRLNVPLKRAWEMVGDELARIAAESPEQARETLALELERLDAMQVALWNKATEGDAQAVDRILKIMERRERLLGLGPGTIDVQEAMSRLAEGLVRLRNPQPAAALPEPRAHEEQRR